VYEIIKNALDEHADVEQAMALAIAKVMAMPDFTDHVEALVSHAVHNVTHAIRSRRNEAPPPPRVKKPWDAEAAKPKVGSELLSPGIREIYRDHCNRVVHNHYNLNFVVSGRVLGELTREELLPLADKEESIGNGHLFNARLLRALRPHVKAGRTVRDCVSIKKLAAIWVKAKAR
jgi:hypothetical protein